MASAFHEVLYFTFSLSVVACFTSTEWGEIMEMQREFAFFTAARLICHSCTGTYGAAVEFGSSFLDLASLESTTTALVVARSAIFAYT